MTTALSPAEAAKLLVHEQSELRTRPATGVTTASASSARLRYRRTLRKGQRWRIAVFFLAAVVPSGLILCWIAQFPGLGSHLPAFTGGRAQVISGALSDVLLCLLGLVEISRIAGALSLAWSAWIATDVDAPPPDSSLRVAFVTTIVPSAEPLEMVRKTLAAARRIRYAGVLDVWLLDEGDDPLVREMCRELGIRHFSRREVPAWNRRRGAFRARSKHGNHNSWLTAHGDAYDIVLGVDPDHVPSEDFAERTLGYFRDPDVAFVNGPQTYGNIGGSVVARGAEAQSGMFHAVMQRAGNHFGSCMFVGTNHAYRVSAFRQAGGFQASITEDLATSLAVHTSRNPLTANRWRSVYTPAVIAVGEGPATWTDLFNQQLRWARGSNEILLRRPQPRELRLTSGAQAYYRTLLWHYPLLAARWLVAVALVVGTALDGTSPLGGRPWATGLVLYGAAAAGRVLPSVLLHRFTVCPSHQRVKGLLSGAVMSALCLPVYVAALVSAMLRWPLGFIVTRKGDAATADGLETFQRQLTWAGLLGCCTAASCVVWRGTPAGMFWAVGPLLVCLLPIVMWAMQRLRHRDRRPQIAVAPRRSGVRPAAWRKWFGRAGLALTAVGIVLVAGSCDHAQAPSPAPSSHAWTTLWRDDFNGPAGAAPSSAWITDTGTCYLGCSSPHWGTGQVETDTASAHNVRLDGHGDLQIAATSNHGQWTSARLESRSVFRVPADGVLRIEARLRFPAVNTADGGGYWPAFWLLGGDYRPTHTGWPLVGELDVAEAVNGQRSVFSTFHCGQLIGGPCGEPTGLGTGARPCPDCASSFHDYAVEIDSKNQQVRWYADGVQVLAVSATQIGSAAWQAATSHGFFILLDLAIGGQFPAALGKHPNSATAQGKPLTVGYVAVSAQSG